jgi:hypothetical protein
MKCYGRAALCDFLGERIIYRGLNVMDERLPGLEVIRAMLGLTNGALPRKTSLEYAQIVVHLLNEARRLDGKKEALQRVVYIGDTLMNDGMAFRNICQMGGWQGAALITSEDQKPTRLEAQIDERAMVFQNNHWLNLRIFATLLEVKGMVIDEGTAVLIDVDKTALGARGRNDASIDQARLSAAKATLHEILDHNFNQDEFQTAYNLLNRPVFHPFTADNQDYLVYICMILSCGLLELGEIQAAAQTNKLTTFDEFLEQVERRSAALPDRVRAVHREVYALVKTGDSTPFKQFRQAEYLATVAAMGQLAEDASIEEMLASEILVTREVQEFALLCADSGALVFGLSDKPDEATKLNSPSSRPLHQVQTHVVGGMNERK